MTSNSLAGFSLDNIITGKKIKPPKVIIYGEAGVGKTTWAAKAPNPILIPTEDGVGILDIPRFPMIKTWNDFLDAMKLLMEGGHGYKTVIIDSISMLEPLVWQQVRVNTGKEVMDHGFHKGYLYALDVWPIVLEGLDRLNAMGMCVIVIGHSELTRMEDPEVGSYDTRMISVHKKARPGLELWADAILYAQFKVQVAEIEEGGRTSRRGVGSGVRVMKTSWNPAYTAKNRYSLPKELPLDWTAFHEAFRAGVKEDTPETPKKKKS